MRPLGAFSPQAKLEPQRTPATLRLRYYPAVYTYNERAFGSNSLRAGWSFLGCVSEPLLACHWAIQPSSLSSLMSCHAHHCQLPQPTKFPLGDTRGRHGLACPIGPV